MIRLIDGFDCYTSLPMGWSSVGADLAISSGASRNAWGAGVINNHATDAQSMTLQGVFYPSRGAVVQSARIMGMAVNIAASPSETVPLVEWLRQDGTVGAKLSIKSTGALVMWSELGESGGTASTGGDYSITSLYGTWWYLEVMGGSGINGQAPKAVKTNVYRESTILSETAYTRTATGMTGVRITLLPGMMIDDLYMGDDVILVDQNQLGMLGSPAGTITATRTSEFQGNVYVKPRLPISDGGHLGMTPSAGANWACAADEDLTDYNSLTAVHTYDSYNYTDVSELSINPIRHTQTTCIAQGLGDSNRRLIQRSQLGDAGQSSRGDDEGWVPLGTERVVRAGQAVNGVTDAQWTGAELTAAQFGPGVI